MACVKLGIGCKVARGRSLKFVIDIEIYLQLTDFIRFTH